MTGTGVARTILLVGKPASGKETQAKLLSDETGFHVLSTGEKFRELREHRDQLGTLVRGIYDTGKLMPAWFADYLFEDAMVRLPPTTGIIFEGSGRDIDQAERIDTILKWLGRPYRVIHLNISDEEAVRRQVQRAKETNRPESDTEEKIKIRLDEFHKISAPAIEYFRAHGNLIDIDGERDRDEIHADIMSRFGIS